MPGDDLVLGGYVPTDELVELLCARSRGLAAYLHTHVVDADASALSHPMRSAIDTMHGDELLRLLDAWQVSVLASARDPVCAASRFTDASICAFGMPLKPGESARPWYKLMDAGAVFFDDADLARAVHFLHPSDAGTLLLHFGRAAASADELSPAQKLSLIAPQLTSADEENERLVLESLACLSAAGKLSLHDGLVVNDVRHAPTTISLGPPSASVQVAELASAAKRSLFCKEFPDMRGADGVALTLRPATAAGYLLLRVQIKLSAGVGCTRVTGPMATKWVNKLKASSAEICGPLAAALGGGAEVEARHIMWVAQDMCATARAVFSNHANVSLLIDRSNMLSCWSPRIRRFVEEQGLTQYGAVATA